MEVILKQDVHGLGYKNDVVDVKPGYGRNYLIPQGIALLASPSNKKALAENVKQAAHKAAKVKEDAEQLSTKLEGLVVEVGAKVGESGKIFGAVTTLQISDSLKDKGYEVDRRKIAFNSDIKTEGEHTVTLDLHREVKQDITVKVVAE